MHGAERQFTLLLVDDNPTNLTLLEKIIELDLPQVRALTASNARDGLDLAAREQLDGAFIDVQMPEVSGLEMCRQLRADPRTANMPLVLLTAHMASPELRAEGLEVGAYDFICQPISNVEMLARIKVMLRLCEGERNRRQQTPESTPAVEESAQLRWLSGLLLSANGQLGEAEQQLLAELAGELASAELSDALLTRLLLERLPPAWRRTFLKLALLDVIPLPLAGKLSELKELEAVFDYLLRQDLLLEAAADGERLRFRPAVRQQLLERIGQLFEPVEQQQICQLAADWFRQKQDPLAAFACLLQGRLYPEISQLISQSGLQLWADPQQPQLLALLEQIPEELAVGCGWLSLYCGIAYLIRQPQEADTWLELARSRFVADSDPRGELLALSLQLVQYLVGNGRIELGPPRLERLRELAAEQLDYCDSFTRLKVLFSQALGELYYAGDLVACEELATRAMAEASRRKQAELQLDIALLQVMLGLFQGRFRVARSAIEQARNQLDLVSENCLARRIFGIVAGELLFAAGELEAFAGQRYQVRQQWGAERFQQSCFVSLLNFFRCLHNLAEGDYRGAEESLELALAGSPTALRAHQQSWLLQLRGLLQAQAGRREPALADCRKALELRAKVPIELHRLPNLLLAGGTALLLQEYAQAAEYLQAGLELSQQLGEGRCRPGLHAWLAALAVEQGDTEAAQRQLEQLCQLLRQQGADFFFALTPELVRKLVPLAADMPEAAEQLQRMAQRWLGCGVAELGRLVPLARLQTLGAYKYCLSERCCDLSEVGASSRQLLALLTVAPNRAMSSELLMGILWPESPPSKARNSFDAALSRLRRVLEGYFGKQVRKDYLVLEKGMLLLRHLQVDASEYREALDQARRQLVRQNLWQAELAFQKAEQLWQGEFLAGYELVADLPYRQDEFRQLRLEQLSGLAELLQRRGELEKAAQLLQRGLQLDPTNDLLVASLLALYQRQGEKRAVRGLLDNYRSALAKEDYTRDEIDELIAALGPQGFEL